MEENESEDDDVQWYKDEVGEEPDEGRSSSFILMGSDNSSLLNALYSIQAKK